MRPPSGRERFFYRKLSYEIRTIIHGGKPPRLEPEKFVSWKYQTLRWNVWIKWVPPLVLREWARDFVELHGRAEACTPPADEVARVKLTAFYRERADAHPDYGFGAVERHPGYIKRGVGAKTVAAAMKNAAFDRMWAKWDEERRIRRERYLARVKRNAFRDKLRAAWRRKRMPIPVEPEPVIVGGKYTYESIPLVRSPLSRQKLETRMRRKSKARLQRVA